MLRYYTERKYATFLILPKFQLAIMPFHVILCTRLKMNFTYMLKSLNQAAVQFRQISEHGHHAVCKIIIWSNLSNCCLRTVLILYHPTCVQLYDYCTM